MQKFIREQKKVRFILRNIKQYDAADIEASTIYLKELEARADAHIQTLDPDAIEQEALHLTELVVNELAFVQGIAGGYDYDPEGGSQLH